MLSPEVIWLESSRFCRFVSTKKGVYSFSFLQNVSQLSEESAATLIHAPLFPERQVIFKSVIPCMDQLLNEIGPDSYFFPSLDIDLLAHLLMNQEIRDFFTWLREKKLNTIFFANLGSLKALFPVWQQLLTDITTSEAEWMRSRCRIVFSGIGQPLAFSLRQWFENALTYSSDDDRQLDAAAQRIVTTPFPNEADTVQLLQLFQELQKKIPDTLTLLLDDPKQISIVGNSLQSADVYTIQKWYAAFITKSLLRAGIHSNIPLYFFDIVSKNRYPLIVKWLEQRGHQVFVASEMFMV